MRTGAALMRGRSNWSSREQAARKLREPIDAGDTVSVPVPVHVSGDRKGMPLSVAVRPPDHADRDSVYGKLTLG
ncbi:hypothetical protein ADL22_24935 [Streptomyces sp. NRRL F-4489]|nr:hypothetical protein ADL22_24935 [Streptomyces sp. NRRL F-4489]